MPYKNKEQRLQYGKTYMNKKRKVLSVISVMPAVPNFTHYHIQWTRRLYKVHREFYKSAWFARWKYQILQVHKGLRNPILFSNSCVLHYPSPSQSCNSIIIKTD